MISRRLSAKAERTNDPPRQTKRLRPYSSPHASQPRYFLDRPSGAHSPKANYHAHDWVHVPNLRFSMVLMMSVLATIPMIRLGSVLSAIVTLPMFDVYIMPSIFWCGHSKLNFTFECGVGGAAAGIWTRVFSLRLSNFEAWEAPVIDQVILTARL